MALKFSASKSPDETISVEYLNAKAVLYVDGRSHVEFPDTPKVRNRIAMHKPNANVRELVNPPTNRLRIDYHKNHLGELFTDIEKIMI